MTTTVALVSCGKRKRSATSPARDLYTSPTFRLSRSWAETCADRWFVLSAKHGLVHPGSYLDPYDLSLSSLPAIEITKWYDQVASALLEILEQDDVVVLLTGSLYGDGVRARIGSERRMVLDPLRGMTLSRRQQWLGSQIRLGKSSAHLERFYEELQLLAGTPVPESLEYGQNWPQRGVYFFFEPGEYRSNGRDLRVTRVGTHALRVGSRTNLRDRLRNHIGSPSGGGSHRSSAFRLHVGAALINRDKMVNRYPDWGKGRDVSAGVREDERPLEWLVSREIANMRVVMLSVNDASSAHGDRAYIERNVIALLSTAGRVADPPSKHWLGQYARNESVRASGMWNAQHTGDSYDDRFLNVLHEYVLITAGRKPSPTSSLAPKGWWLSR
jgi:hypothetical protein